LLLRMCKGWAVLWPLAHQDIPLSYQKVLWWVVLAMLKAGTLDPSKQLRQQ
jgi:hypothetical protein